MELKLTGDVTPYNPDIVSLRCPACRHSVAFKGVGQNDIACIVSSRDSNNRPVAAERRFGLRQCPRPECRAVVMIARQASEMIVIPPETIDFDPTNLPAPILASLEEAIKCHAAGCYKASAIMIRRTLEDLCEDRNAQGGDLKKRIAALGTTVVIPAELLSAADHLRLLGNDAAHIEAKTYNSVGHAESALAITLAKELLKAVYQYSTLVSQLKALQKP